jgi:hypothetical protein
LRVTEGSICYEGHQIRVRVSAMRFISNSSFWTHGFLR